MEIRMTIRGEKKNKNRLEMGIDFSFFHSLTRFFIHSLVEILNVEYWI